MSETTLKARIQDDLHAAMRERDQVRSGTLRMALAAITNAEVAGDTAKELTDDETLKVVAKEAKKRKEAIEAYQGAGREDLASKESAELVVLEGYLPAQLSDEEIAAIVDAVVAETGASGMQQMGQVMKGVQERVAGRADGGRIAPLVKARLQG